MGPPSYVGGYGTGNMLKHELQLQGHLRVNGFARKNGRQSLPAHPVCESVLRWRLLQGAIIEAITDLVGGRGDGLEKELSLTRELRNPKFYI
jgi:hypothetical protein